MEMPLKRGGPGAISTEACVLPVDLGRGLQVQTKPIQGFAEEHARSGLHLRSRTGCSGRQIGERWVERVEGEPQLSAACGSLSSDFVAFVLLLHLLCEPTC